MKKWIAGIFALLCLVFLALIFWDAPNREVVWFIVPIGGLFRMIGGTWWKAVGRFLTPVLPVLAVLLLGGFSWWLLLVYGAYLLVKTLPFTLIGDSVKDSWLNWIWIPTLGLINGAVCLSLLPIVGWSYLWTALIACAFPLLGYGIFGILSNVKPTAKFFPWKLCEFVFGSSAMIPPAMLIDHFYGGII